ncbi:MAG: glutaredoxin family protein [Candidatus Eisenbacteria bacterium]|nr:glutaredoxin family protein [Candidatus Eisenbacteria bacterium]
MNGEWQSIQGENSSHDVVFYGLSTCVWCKKTRKLLEDSDVSFRYLDVDLVPREKRGGVVDELKRVNPTGSFPTVVIDGDKVVVGYRPEQLMEELGL